MSALTSEGRKRIHDRRHETLMRQINRDTRLAAIPTHQRVTLSELKLIGRDLYLNIRQRGVMLPDGTVNSAVEAHRKNAHEQLVSLQVFMELNRTQNHDATIDVVQLMQPGQGESLEPAPAEPDNPEPESK